jgi:glycosyltransferase involved in cell wall biosynthesis
MTPVISVIMPVRNGAAFVREAIESVLRQEFRDFELVIVDDGSEEESARLLAEFSRHDDRIVLVRQEPLGITAALNRAVAVARGALLARLDGDDRARPDRLARQLTYLEAHAEIGLLGSAAEAIDGSGAVIGRITPPTDPVRLRRLLARTNPFIHSSVMMRAVLVRKLGGYRAAFRAAEDYDLWLRMAEAAGIANLPDPLVQYRRHGSNLSRLDAVRQAFSVRLAQTSAAARRAGTDDPGNCLESPPDWWAAQAMNSVYAKDVGLYRFLSADPTEAPRYMRALERRLLNLNHTERKLAQARLREMLDDAPIGARRARIACLIALLHPGRALRLVRRATADVAPRER